ncbi:HNH endonuclease signature motif containing protein [Nesterenkonia sp. CL21]|uniref:HNH endonuclease n=1 Tax=Nesterenkonia sp. CL21 TaxID=3064894 RepID=UPI002878FC99|nr:HNH endonuclease signature motif containing protein [Nesterenkonia sp. CL21]MDS2171621.1 HNH endonuclease signature motif containing protein [Nesterenkonia sp. CL21]
MRILRRDAYACQLCGAEATEVDHIKAGDDHSDENLQAICTPCHARKSSSEGGAARARELRQLRAMIKRKPEQTPGRTHWRDAKPRENKGF